jgi:hypothetical protein
LYDNAVGASGLTVIFRLKVVLPPLLEAVTVYVAWLAAAVGVPEITPVAALSVKPAGSAALTVYPVTVPVTEGVRDAAFPTTIVLGLG